MIAAHQPISPLVVDTGRISYPSSPRFSHSPESGSGCGSSSNCSPEQTISCQPCLLEAVTFDQVVAALEKCDPSYSPSFYCALEIVKRYTRSKIAKGKKNYFVMKGGKLESLEAKFAHLGYQDVFYLTRLQLCLPPSHRSLPCPTPPVLQVLKKAKYPLGDMSACVAAAEKKLGKSWWK
ncbi:hypothetical protein CI109_102131 [Kwoniella shandongensis]|uniref:Uncharacterized protein n=1 Tax=Kwoniella shandongensis TaxID=1734106 RepID=A0A5M6BZ00_9TREE|nr:uncharacterized protein CI109_003709 [Kwoniella shandongensis]KAA5528054.1 hypothetical protein CI109_003709 [Kwoniella shandongensis]